MRAKLWWVLVHFHIPFTPNSPSWLLHTFVSVLRSQILPAPFLQADDQASYFTEKWRDFSQTLFISAPTYHSLSYHHRWTIPDAISNQRLHLCNWSHSFSSTQGITLTFLLFFYYITFSIYWVIPSKNHKSNCALPQPSLNPSPCANYFSMNLFLFVTQILKRTLSWSISLLYSIA